MPFVQVQLICGKDFLIMRTSKVDLTLKSLRSTRWSCRADACKAPCGSYAQIRDVLERISSDPGEKRDTRNEASAPSKKSGSLKTSFMTQFWNRVSSRFKATSESLQKADIDLTTAIRLFESLKLFLLSIRDRLDHFETSAKIVPGICRSYKDELQRNKKRKIFSDESTEHEITLKGRERFLIEPFSVVTDSLVNCLEHRMNAYSDINKKFSILLNMDSKDPAAVRKQADGLAVLFPSDLDENLADEIIQFRCFIQTEEEKSPPKLLQVLLKHRLQSIFPDVFVALRMFLTPPVTNCEGERLFS